MELLAGLLLVIIRVRNFLRLPQSQESYYLVNLLAAHLLCHGVVAWVHANERGRMIAINLDTRKIWNTILALAKDAMTARTIHLIEDSALLAFLQQQHAILLSHMRWYIIRHLLLGIALLQ